MGPCGSGRTLPSYGCPIWQAIIFCHCGFFFLLSSFFFAYSQWLQIGCLPYFRTWFDLGANLECRSEMCCMRRAENTGCKNLPSAHIAQICQAISSQLRHVSAVGKKLVKQQYVLHMSSQYGELRSTNGWDWLASLGHPSKFQRVLHLDFVTAATSLNGGQPNFARRLAISWAGTVYIHFRGLLSPNGILPGAKFAWCPGLAFS